MGLVFQSNVLYKSTASKTLCPIWILIKKVLDCIGQLGLEWMSPSKARANEVERTPTTNDIVLFRSPATWMREARHRTKTYEQWQGPKKRARVNNLGKWANIQSKVAFSGINRNRRLGLSLRSPCAGVATGLLMVWHELFPIYKHGCRKGAGIWKFQQKRVFSWFRVVNSKFHHFCSPPRKNVWKNPLVAPLEKSFRRPCTEAWKITPVL